MKPSLKSAERMKISLVLLPLVRNCAVVFLWFVATAATVFGAETRPAAPEVKLVAPTRGEIHRFVTLPGTVRPWQSATLFARVPGYLKSIGVDRGDEVAAGAVLAEIDAPELAADLSRAEAEVAQATAMQAKATADLEKAKADAARARAEMPRAKAELDIARLEFQRAHSAQQKAPDLVVQQTVDTAKARLEIAEATQAAALATVDAAAAAAQAAAAGREVAAAMREVALTGVARAGAVAGFRKIVAPFAGTITDRRVDPGAFISPASGGNAAAQKRVGDVDGFSHGAVAGARARGGGGAGEQGPAGAGDVRWFAGPRAGRGHGVTDGGRVG